MSDMFRLELQVRSHFGSRLCALSGPNYIDLNMAPKARLTFEMWILPQEGPNFKVSCPRTATVWQLKLLVQRGHAGLLRLRREQAQVDGPDERGVPPLAQTLKVRSSGFELAPDTAPLANFARRLARVGVDLQLTWSDSAMEELSEELSSKSSSSSSSFPSVSDSIQLTEPVDDSVPPVE